MIRGLVAALLIAVSMTGVVWEYVGGEKVEMISQLQWGSKKLYPDGGLAGRWNPELIVIHWGGMTRERATKALAMQTLRGWQSYHLRKGWRDIAYNYAIDELGNMYRLRGENPSGATSGRDTDGIRWNEKAVNIVWIGGKSDANGPSELAKATLARYAVERGMDVIGHQETGKATSCPGQDWLDYIHGIDSEVDYMRIGDTGKDVVKLQDYLNRYNRVFGDPSAVIKMDGEYGPNTSIAVGGFQEWANLALGDASALTLATLTALVVPNVGVVS